MGSSPCSSHKGSIQHQSSSSAGHEPLSLFRRWDAPNIWVLIQLNEFIRLLRCRTVVLCVLALAVAFYDPHLVGASPLNRRSSWQSCCVCFDARHHTPVVLRAPRTASFDVARCVGRVLRFARLGGWEVCTAPSWFSTLEALVICVFYDPFLD